MYKYTLAIGLSIILTGSFAQNKPGTSFYGDTQTNVGVCPKRVNALSEADVINLITEMLGRYGIKNRYIILNCTEVDNCQATLYEGKPYILYNPNFLNSVKKLNFKNADLPVTDKDWSTLTILAHELGHHVNNHLINPLPDATQWDMELEADETAGFIIYLMKGTLSQAQLTFKDIDITGSYTHPGRQKRLEAIAKGWNDAKKKYPPAKEYPVSNTVQDRDGNTYKTIKIGEQIWMQSNLNVSKFNDGTIIREAKTNAEWEVAYSKREPAWCYYENNILNGKKYGKLYNWYAINDPRGLAPKGWHVPSDAEWNKLENILGGSSLAGGKLKEAGNKNWRSPNAEATNSSGWAGLPGGVCLFNGDFEYIGVSGFWWNSSESFSELIWYRGLHNHVGLLERVEDSDKRLGFSVRCIKD